MRNNQTSFHRTSAAPSLEPQRFIGIDAGAETLKIVELRRENAELRVVRRQIIEHGKRLGATLQNLLSDWDWQHVDGAAISGRFAGQLKLPQIPVKQAQLRGCQFLFGTAPATIVNIGSHGFSVLEIRSNGPAMYRENSRCSQGTGNFLRQLVERFSLTVEEASDVCADVPDPAVLSGRCPVILKTDMTHLANKGESRTRILAGLFDAVCENVLVLLKPGAAPDQVLLTGGVCRSPRVRRVIGQLLARQQMRLLDHDIADTLYLEAVGCAVLAAESPRRPMPASELVQPPRKLQLEQLSSLADSMRHVRRMQREEPSGANGQPRPVVLGFDIGSTGSKVVAIDAQHQVVWEDYRQTLGNPVGAAQELLQRFVQGPVSHFPIAAFGATGSGREIAGSLLSACYGSQAVTIINEIVAHATGALHYDSRVDTIFEIGGQDAKYIRLSEGRIVDCAMNEACSAGTGSFIEEQGRRLSGVGDVRQLGLAALAAPHGVSLGQHCSVFMAEVIDEAITAGVEQSAVISGLYDSIIKNYLNRVKGQRSVGKVIFCQGMPFSADALAAAVARQTGSDVIVPPNPGTVGALGIALLAAREMDVNAATPLDPAKFLQARIEQKDTFHCGSTRGCGGAGNHCRIERLRTSVCSQSLSFTWGGGCSMYDKGTRKRKLPDLAPDPFRQREALLSELIASINGTDKPASATAPRKPRIALSDEFMLKGLFPFFAAFFHQAGYALEIVGGAGHETLKRGIQSATVPFCAPMQLYHGLAEQLVATGAEQIFIPMLRSVPRAGGQRCSVVCPIVQAAPDVIRCAISTGAALLSPVIDFDEGNLESGAFPESCRRLASELKLSGSQWRSAWNAGLAAQKRFDAECEQIGRRALEFCREHGIVPVVVLGRSYTIYNKVLNSNVPAILREQGAIAVPVDCFPVDTQTPLFEDMYWGYGQNILRAAHQARRTQGVYALYCSNYSCGPDSFTLHFAAHVMEGKPFAVIETDGHSGDAGTKTRVEAFLHCVEEDRRAPRHAEPNEAANLQFSGNHLRHIGRGAGAERLLIPYMSQASESVAAVFRGLGLNAESLPQPNPETLRLGRRYTSGKECLPMPLTLGSLLHRLESAQDGEHFAYLMPSTDGPCRFGVYNMLNNIVLEKLGWRERVRIWSPNASGYFDDIPPGAEMLILAGITAVDFLRQAVLDTRPLERERGSVNAIHAAFSSELYAQLEKAGGENLSLPAALWQVASGRIFGVRDILRRAAAQFASARSERELPVVTLAGEIYVRNVDFSNDFVIDKLEARGLRVHLAPQVEWINYCGHQRQFEKGRNRLADGVSNFIQEHIESAAFNAMARPLNWEPMPTSDESIAAAKPYVNAGLSGEAVLTVGAPLIEWRRGQIDGVVNVGPLECMPAKIAEAQYHHLAERDGVLCLTLAYNGDPIGNAALDNFAYEVKTRFKKRQELARRLAAKSAGAEVAQPVQADALGR